MPSDCFLIIRPVGYGCACFISIWTARCSGALVLQLLQLSQLLICTLCSNVYATSTSSPCRSSLVYTAAALHSGTATSAPTSSLLLCRSSRCYDDSARAMTSPPCATCQVQPSSPGNNDNATPSNKLVTKHGITDISVYWTIHVIVPSSTSSVPLLPYHLKRYTIVTFPDEIHIKKGTKDDKW